MKDSEEIKRVRNRYPQWLVDDLQEELLMRISDLMPLDRKTDGTEIDSYTLQHAILEMSAVLGIPVSDLSHLMMNLGQEQ